VNSPKLTPKDALKQSNKLKNADSRISPDTKRTDSKLWYSDSNRDTSADEKTYSGHKKNTTRNSIRGSDDDPEFNGNSDGIKENLQDNIGDDSDSNEITTSGADCSTANSSESGTSQSGSSTRTQGSAVEQKCKPEGWKTKYGKNCLRRGKTLRLCSKAYSNYEFTIKMTKRDWRKCVLKTEI